MKNEKLLDAIGKIDDKLIYDAVNDAPKKKIPLWVKWGSIAACLVLIFGVTAAIVHISNSGDNNLASSDTNSVSKSQDNKLKDIRDGEDSANNQQGESVILPKIKVENENLIQYFKRTNLNSFTAVNLSTASITVTNQRLPTAV